MAIATMSKLQVLAPTEQRRDLLRSLSGAGCVEIDQLSPQAQQLRGQGLLKEVSNFSPAAQKKQLLDAALEVLDRYYPHKKGFLTPRPEVTPEALFNPDRNELALTQAERVYKLGQELSDLGEQATRLRAQQVFLAPWTCSDIPLDHSGGEEFILLRGACPLSADIDQLLREAESDAPLSQVDLLFSDAEQHYFLIAVHREQVEALWEILRPHSFSALNFDDYQGLAADCLAQLEQELAENEAHTAKTLAHLHAFQTDRVLLEEAADALAMDAEAESFSSSMLSTQETVYFEAWVPEKLEQGVARILAEQDCAWAFTPAQEEDEPPVLLNNNNFVSPFGAITELYGMPAYRSLIDPNPFVAVSFILFFGIMLGDAMYGLIIALGAYIYLRLARPSGGLRKYLRVAIAVGIAAVVWGACCGSWFGDFATALGNMLGKEWRITPLLFDPLADPITMLIISIAIGAINLFLGMGLAGYRMIRQGQWVDAVCDIGLWYLVIIGALALLLGAGIGLYMAAAGAIGILLTAGRAKAKWYQKITGGLGALYGVTNYMSDILSHSRLMALCLASSVVASVVNTMGSLLGSSIIGWLLFIIMFLGGQVFNLAISILGAFVHSARLEYVEFFGRFFEGGGRKFEPLYFNTKYVQVVKEET